MQAHKRLVAVESEKAASGMITYWSLSGKVPHDKLTQAWVAAGLPDSDLPSTPSAIVALKRAIDNVAPTGSIIKPLKEEDGYTVMQKSEEEGAKQKWETKFSAYFSDVGKLTVFISDGDQSTMDDHANERAKRLAADIEDHMDLELGQLHPQDLSVWLVWMVEKRLKAVSLRDSGGFYFVPRGETQEKWERVVEVVHSVCDTKVLTIPAMSSEQATLAVVHALTEEVTARTKDMQEALIEARMGKRAMSTKIDSCTDMLDKINTYEELLGQKLEHLHDAVDVLKAKYVEAWSVENARQD